MTTENENGQTKYRILSLDGGGLRGVLSARILKKVEEILETKGHKLHTYFDLVAGTSTGSILAGAIACQKSAEEIINLYKNEGKNIFPDSVRWRRKWRRISQFLGSNVLYPHEKGKHGLAKVLERNLQHPSLGSLKIKDIQGIEILILAYDTYFRETTWFTNNSPEQKKWYDDIELSKICTASASAPTFFPPYELPSGYPQQKLPYIDGGVSSNNPSLAAIAHALYVKNKLDNSENKEKLKLSDIALMSIGTGKTSPAYTYQEVKDWGQLGWVTHLSDMFLDPSEQIAEAISGQIFKSVDGDRLRLDFELNEYLKRDQEQNQLPEKEDNPYNKYIFEHKGERKKISEAIDNPDDCQDLIEVAESYLECGKADYNNSKIVVKEAIAQFIDSNPKPISNSN